nr:MAG TPA: hypothetical protein [Caudoviricetes sp.]
MVEHTVYLQVVTYTVTMRFNIKSQTNYQS